MKNKKTVSQFLDDNPYLANGGLRGLIFNAEKNGLNKFNVIYRIGRRILIDEDNFYKWLDAINEKVA